MSRLAVITDIAVGGTFLTWSILWLSGQNEYFSTKENKQLNLIANPLTNQNSHQFLVNQARDPLGIQQILNSLPTDNKLHHLYFHILRNKQEYQETDSIDLTKQGIELSVQNCEKIIVVNNHKEYSLYNCSFKQRSAPFDFYNGSKVINDNELALENFINYFFQKSLDKWGKLTEVWDKREFLALNFNPRQKLYLRDCHKFDFNFFELPAHALWLSLDIYIKDILDYCNLTLDHSRFDHWHQIYNKWKKLHQDRIQFCWYFDTIVNNIVDNRDMDLTKFDLDIVREAAIQHELIYTHNLNFKTWQLEKFVNTKQLHNLLEPNTHPLSS